MMTEINKIFFLIIRNTRGQFFKRTQQNFFRKKMFQNTPSATVRNEKGGTTTEPIDAAYLLST